MLATLLFVAAAATLIATLLLALAGVSGLSRS